MFEKPNFDRNRIIPPKQLFLPKCHYFCQSAGCEACEGVVRSFVVSINLLLLIRDECVYDCQFTETKPIKPCLVDNKKFLPNLTLSAKTQKMFFIQTL